MSTNSNIFRQAGGWINEVDGMITRRVDTLNGVLDTFEARLLSVMDALAKVLPEDEKEPNMPRAPDAPALSINLPEQPTASLTAPDIGNAPNAPSIDAALGALDMSGLDIPAAPDFPTLNLPAAPTMRDIALPAEPVVDGTVDFPDKPDMALPEMDALLPITIPEFQFPELPDFDGKVPTLDAQPPEVFINWAEPEYASELYDELVAKIREWLKGGTGLPPEVEDELFSRARERDSKETERAVQAAFTDWAARGFTMPPGMLAAQVNAAREEGRLKAAELNRDILIEAAKWEIENIRVAVQQGIALEQLSMNLWENAIKRLFEVARFNAEALMNAFNARIALFNAQMQGFGALVQLYKARLDGALAKLTAYKTAVEAQQAIGQLNQQKVEIFKAKLQAVHTSAEIFSTLMRGAEIKAGIIAKEYDAYRTRIQAYAEQIGAEKVKFDAYRAQVDGETAKAHMFEASTRAYAETVRAISTKADLKIKQQQLKLDSARLKIQGFEAQVSAFKARTDATLTLMKHEVDVFHARVQAWQAGANANMSEAEMQMRFADNKYKTNIAYIEAQIHEFQAKVQKAIQDASLAVEKYRAIGQYATQMAAGAMSAIHISNGLNASSGVSATYNESFQAATA